jgi:hypothetical protein
VPAGGDQRLNTCAVPTVVVNIGFGLPVFAIAGGAWRKVLGYW